MVHSFFYVFKIKEGMKRLHEGGKKQPRDGVTW